MIHPKLLIKTLEDAGYEWRSYSGRGMFGKQCVGVDLDDTSDLWDLARALAELNIPAPIHDSMGRGVIFYWPSAKIEEQADEQ